MTNPNLQAARDALAAHDNHTPLTGADGFALIGSVERGEYVINQIRPLIESLIISDRLEALRVELRAERISYGELAELQGLARFIDPSDTELLEAAGVPEFDDEDDERGEVTTALYCRTSNQGTAMSEAVLCAEHFTEPHTSRADDAADSANDAGPMLWVVSNNPEIACVVCGAVARVL